MSLILTQRSLDRDQSNVSPTPLNSALAAHQTSPGTLPYPAQEPSVTIKKLLDILKLDYLPRLQWNILQQLPMIDGDTVNISTIEMEIVEKYNIHVDTSKLTNYLTALAKEKPFNPVTAYLDRVSNTPASSDIIDRLASEALGLVDVLERTYLTRFLVAAVARAFQPGCKVDTMLILQGSQGYRKTTFFSALFGDEFFSTMGELGSERDELLSLHQHWCVEFGEFETTTTKKDVSALKNFLSRQVDNFRAPYASRSENYPRHFVLCGTTNKEQFLFDDTGNRRYWVAHVPQPINLEWVKEHKDEIWAAAVSLYKAGQTWWLTQQEQELSDSTNKAFESKSVWEELVTAWLQGNYCASSGTTYYTGQPLQAKDVLLNAVGKQAGQWSKGDEMQVGKVLKSLGFEKKDTKVNGVKGKYWTQGETSTAVIQRVEFSAPAVDFTQLEEEEDWI